MRALKMKKEKKMNASTIIEINKIRENDFWNGQEPDYSSMSSAAAQFVQENYSEMHSTAPTFNFVKGNFGVELTPFQILQVNCGGIENVSERSIDSYRRIYGDVTPL